MAIDRHFFSYLVGFSLIATSVSAADSNYGEITLASDRVSGRTGGSVSLPAIVANRDSNGNDCLGFGSDIPDFILQVDSDTDDLRLSIDSGGRDTTIVVRRISDNTVWCGDDTETNPDASVRLTNLVPGTYQVWVGAFEPGSQWDYTLSTIAE